MKYFRTFAGLMAIVIMMLTVVSVADATTKSRALLQTDLDNDKLDTFSPHLMHENMTNMTDSHFNLTTDAITDIGTITATEAEINKIADDSARVLSVSGSSTFTCATNGTGVINYISSSASNATITLPAATGSGCGYQLTWDNVPTASGDIIQVTGNDEFQGVVYTLSDDSDALKGWAAAVGGDNDQITYNSTTQMGATAGVTLLVTDVTTDVYAVEAVGSSTGTEVTPFATGQRP